MVERGKIGWAYVRALAENRIGCHCYETGNKNS
jgi:hypothetical protein